MDFLYGIKKCCTMLQGIGSGLMVTGKGIASWILPKVGGGVIVINGVLHPWYKISSVFAPIVFSEATTRWAICNE